MEQPLLDGSYLTSFTSGKGRAAAPARMRVPHYTVTTTDPRTGAERSEEFRGATS